MVWRRQQHGVEEAAAWCGGGSSKVWRRQQHGVEEAAAATTTADVNMAQAA
jgi:hypothetical protein